MNRYVILAIKTLWWCGAICSAYLIGAFTLWLFYTYPFLFGG